MGQGRGHKNLVVMVQTIMLNPATQMAKGAIGGMHYALWLPRGAGGINHLVHIIGSGPQRGQHALRIGAVFQGLA